MIEGEATQVGDSGDDSIEGEEGEDQVEGEDAEDEVEISFDGEAAPASRGENSGLVKQLRAQLREKSERLAAIERGQQQPQKVEVGEKPTLEACDYDEAKFETELDAWKERKAQADRAQEEAGKQSEAVQARFAEKLQTFATGKTALGVRDFEAAEEMVVNGLSQVQQAIVIKAAENSAAVIYALGKHPAKLATLAAIDDPIEFTAAIVKLEGKLTVTKRTRTPPEPDRPERGSAPLGRTTDKELERLEKEAAKSGDRTHVVAYRRKLKAQGRS